MKTNGTNASVPEPSALIQRAMEAAGGILSAQVSAILETTVRLTQMGLFRRPFIWTGQIVRELLRQCAVPVSIDEAFDAHEQRMYEALVEAHRTFERVMTSGIVVAGEVPPPIALKPKLQ